MQDVTSEIRNGVIDGNDITYSITATLNGESVCGAQGFFQTPEGLHLKYSGATKNLIDCETNNEYSIMVTPERFSFMDGYANVKELL